MKKKTIVKIVILIVLIAIISITFVNIYFHNANVKKQKMYDEQISAYLDSVKKWSEDNTSSNSIISKVTLKKLIDLGYTKDGIINPLTNEEFDSNMRFCVINDNGELKYNYDDGINCGETIVTYDNTPKDRYNGYLYSQVVNIDFSNLEGLEYYIKTMRDASTNTNINYSCGKDTNPMNCRSIGSTKNIKANTWYKVSGDIEVTYDESDKENTILYAIVTDNVKYKDINNINVSKIDRNNPVVVLDNPVSTTNSISVSIKNMIDNETDIESSICRYGTSEGEYTTVSMSNIRGKLSKCIINYKLKDKTYYYQVCATDKVGNVGCAKGSSLIQSVNKPTITYNDENEMTVLFNNKKKKNELVYYIKTTKKVILKENTIAYCGKKTLPEECIANEVKEILPNVWYKVSPEVVVIHEKDIKGTLYALIYNEDGYAISSTAKIN